MSQINNAEQSSASQAGVPIFEFDTSALGDNESIWEPVSEIKVAWLDVRPNGTPVAPEDDLFEDSKGKRPGLLLDGVPAFLGIMRKVEKPDEQYRVESQVSGNLGRLGLNFVPIRPVPSEV